MAKYLKIGDRIVNLDLVNFVKFERPTPYNEKTASLKFDFPEDSVVFHNDTAEIVWYWLHEHLDMSVIPMPQEVKA